MKAIKVASRASLCGILGFLLGNVYPFTGGPLVKMAQPFSPIRMDVGILYAVIGAFAGVIILGMVGLQKERE